MDQISQEKRAQEKRAAWMSSLAKADSVEIKNLWQSFEPKPAFVWLRKPEFGSVMTQGRMGGSGAAFNLGEVSVTRCSLRLTESEFVGHAYVQSRDREKAEIAALCDALMQSGQAHQVQTQILDPLAENHAKRHADIAAKAEATRVDFFTLARGEDP